MYVHYSINHKTYQFHSDILDTPDGMQIDHKEHHSNDYVDNRRSNLRIVTPRQNMLNQGLISTNKSGVTGVYRNNRNSKWVAQINVNGKTKHIGVFEELEDAKEARHHAEQEYYGEYAYKGGIQC